MLTTPSVLPPPPARPTQPCAPQVPASVQCARLRLRPVLLAALDYLAAAPQATLYLAVCQGADEHRVALPAWLASLPAATLDATGCDAADALVALLGEEARRAALPLPACRSPRLHPARRQRPVSARGPARGAPGAGRRARPPARQPRGRGAAGRAADVGPLSAARQPAPDAPRRARPGGARRGDHARRRGQRRAVVGAPDVGRQRAARGPGRGRDGGPGGGVMATDRAPIPLIIEGKPVAYACPACHFVQPVWGRPEHAADIAVDHCPPHYCDGGCGVEVNRRMARLCDACRKVANEKARAERDAKDLACPAVPESEWTGPVHLPDAEGGWYASLDELRDEVPPEELPEWVWACSTVRLSLDAADILESATQDACEAAAEQAADLAPQLQPLLDKLLAENTVEWWEETSTRVILATPSAAPESEGR